MTLYSTGHHQSSVLSLLETKLNNAGVMYQICTDANIIKAVAEQHGIGSAPFLITDEGDVLPFTQAIEYVINL